jgi:hypothetical protein
MTLLHLLAPPLVNWQGSEQFIAVLACFGAPFHRRRTSSAKLSYSRKGRISSTPSRNPANAWVTDAGSDAEGPVSPCSPRSTDQRRSPVVNQARPRLEGSVL